MLQLAKRGCSNINLVTPTHYVPEIVAALADAADMGLTLPVVYNCGGYESVDTIRLLDGVIDIYMPDAKYADPVAASRLSQAEDYPTVLADALREMQRQVGDLETDSRGLATRGLLIRHLVLPCNAAGTDAVLELIAREISPTAAVNVMGQYRPHFRVVGRPGPLGRPLAADEHEAALGKARSLGLTVLTD
jgi:putative pyruvate formate lyase activating enzyme